MRNVKRTLARLLALTGLIVPVTGTAQILPGEGTSYLSVHVAPADPERNACDPDAVTGSSCDDLGQGAGLTLTGEVGPEYDVHIIAVDVRTDAGLLGAEFGIQYDAEAIEVLGWWGCGSPSPSPTWPAPGSSFATEFSACRGTEAGDVDPEGDATVVLAVLRVRASAAAVLSLTPVFGGDLPAATLRDCEGTVNAVRGLGAAGFGRDGSDPCSFVVDGGCTFNPLGDQWFCCGPDLDCLDGSEGLSARACVFRGGTVVTRPCSDGMLSCAEVCSTPVSGQSWGSIKALHP